MNNKRVGKGEHEGGGGGGDGDDSEELVRVSDGCPDGCPEVHSIADRSDRKPQPLIPQSNPPIAPESTLSKNHHPSRHHHHQDKDNLDHLDHHQNNHNNGRSSYPEKVEGKQRKVLPSTRFEINADRKSGTKKNDNFVSSFFNALASFADKGTATCTSPKMPIHKKQKKPPKLTVMADMAQQLSHCISSTIPCIPSKKKGKRPIKSPDDSVGETSAHAAIGDHITTLDSDDDTSVKYDAIYDGCNRSSVKQISSSPRNNNNNKSNMFRSQANSSTTSSSRYPSKSSPVSSHIKHLVREGFEILSAEQGNNESAPPSISNLRYTLSVQNSVEGTLQLATALHIIGELAEAEALYLQILEIDCEHYKVNYNLGHLNLDLLKLEESVNYFLIASRLNLNDPDPFISLSIAYKFQNNLEDSLKACYAALQIDPSSVMGLYNLASTYQDMKCHHEAISVYEKALQLNPHHDDAWFNLGLSYAWLSSFGSPSKHTSYSSKANFCFESISSSFVYYEEVLEKLAAYNKLSDDNMTF